MVLGTRYKTLSLCINVGLKLGLGSYNMLNSFLWYLFPIFLRADWSYPFFWVNQDSFARAKKWVQELQKQGAYSLNLLNSFRE